LEGKSVLDVGSGRGIYAFFAAYAGAKRVVCLEPGLEGGHQAAEFTFERIRGTFSFQQVALQECRLQDFDAKGESFDIILLHNSINHLDEDACIRLRDSGEARRTYQNIFVQMEELAHSGTKLIIADCSRYNLFGLLGVKNPMALSIKWHTHQSPYLWVTMLERFGFARKSLRWTTPGRFSQLFLDNPVASFFLISHFVLTMEKA